MLPPVGTQEEDEEDDDEKYDRVPGSDSSPNQDERIRSSPVVSRKLDFRRNQGCKRNVRPSPMLCASFTVNFGKPVRPSPRFQKTCASFTNHQGFRETCASFTRV